MELGGRIAKCSGARLVVTTATDRKGKFAVDLFARANRIKLTGRVLAKEISARILQGETVGFYSDLPVDGEAPEELDIKTSYQQLLEGTGQKSPGIAVLIREPEEKRDHILYLYPRICSVGIGCRRGVGKEKSRRLSVRFLEFTDGGFHRSLHLQVLTERQMRKESLPL